MGQEIDEGSFSDADRAEFSARLRNETRQLNHWFDERTFDNTPELTAGLELEAWLVDENHLPSPRNEEFFATVNDPDIVPELSKFNFEVNAKPQALKSDFLKQTQNDLEKVWDKCVRAAETLRLQPVAIGILPTVRDDMLQPAWMSPSNRYRALNAELLRRRSNEPLHICIEREESIDYRCDHIMLEAACTSLQAHLKISQDTAVRYYNAAVIAAAPLIAATANSPFLYGRSLWEETRIPVFEQATATDNFRDAEGRNVARVTLGTGYLRESFLELFLENLSFPALLPALEDDAAKLPHLRMQNGTVWRWVRPILGFDGAHNPHLRIEHRVMPAGPSMADTAANLALCHGLILALGKAEMPPETETSFEHARENFYACARDGLSAQVHWGNAFGSINTLLREHLLPEARNALAREGVAKQDLEYYFTDILEPRIESGQTGAQWQRRVIDRNGANHQALTERYVEYQSTGAPVHSWAV